MPLLPHGGQITAEVTHLPERTAIREQTERKTILTGTLSAQGEVYVRRGGAMVRLPASRGPEASLSLTLSSLRETPQRSR